MAQFNLQQLDTFLGVVRKYMQVRGPMSQKDLAELADVGVSTMSRFLNRKTTELNPQLIAKIVAKLAIPLHEIIDFVDESYADHFIRLVKFYRQEGGAPVGPDEELFGDSEGSQQDGDEFEDAIVGTLGHGTAQKNANAQVKVGTKKANIPFQSDQTSRFSEMSLKDKLASLSPRQKAYMADFLNLDMEGRDLIVDLGNNLFRYFKQKGMNF